MRVFLAHSGDFVGAAVETALAAAGHELVGAGHGASQNGHTVASQVLAGGADVAVHLALHTREAAEDFAETCRGHVPRLVILSSADVYRAYGRLMRLEPGTLRPMPLDEEAEVRQSLFPYRRQASGPEDSRYHYEKLLVERALLGQADWHATVLRPAAVYGPGAPEHHLYPIVKRVMDGRRAIVIGETAARWRWSWVYVHNLAAVVARAVDIVQKRDRIVNVADEPALPQSDWIEAVGNALGWSGEVVVVRDMLLPAHLLPRVDLRQEFVLDTTRLRTELHHTSPIGLAEALEASVEWERSNPPERWEPRHFDYGAEDLVLARLGRSR